MKTQFKHILSLNMIFTEISLAVKILFLMAFSVLFFSPPLYALPESSPVPGGIVLLQLNNQQIASSARYDNKKLASLQQDNMNYLLVGLSLSTKPGEHFISIQNTNGKNEKITFEVQPKTYLSQHLTIKNKRKVNPYKKDMVRINSERQRKNLAKKHWSDQTVNADFLVPVDGRISSIFGLRRFFNEQARNPHSGLDIAAPQGTPIKAVESGTVIEAGDFFFSGNMAYIDHGQGLLTIYAHMFSVDVKPGDKITKGQIIGSVGETGRVTGPHLHLAVVLNQTLVDPLLFLPQLTDKASEYYKVKAASK